LAVGEQSRARVIYSLPEQRRPGTPGGFGLFGLLALALVLFGGGLAIGHWTGSAPRSRAPAATAPQATTASTAQAPADTAPATPVPASRPLTVNGERVWSGRTVDGVPVGWDHSEAGAVGAATNYTAALASSELMFDAARRGAAVETVAAPQYLDQLRGDLEEQAKLIAASFFGMKDADKALAQVQASKVVFQTIPVRYRLDSYDGATAQVTIWQTGVGGYQDSSLPPQEAWGMTTVKLQWIDKDWKETGATVTDGPVPVADSNPPTPAPDLIHEVQQFKDYHYAPAS
jgi:hypothetical protein